MKALECPVCLDVIKYPMKMCVKGHLMCTDCVSRWTTCPTCQGDLVVDNPVCIRHLLESLPRTCQNSANGCNKLIKKGSSHEMFCEFRIVECYDCDKNKNKVIANQLLLHYRLHHSLDRIIFTKTLPKFKWENFDFRCSRVTRDLVYMFDILFCIKTEYSCEMKQVKIMLEAIPIGEFKGDYYLSASVVNGKFGFRSTVKAFIREANYLSNQEANDESDGMNQFYMVIPGVHFYHLIKRVGSIIIFELEIFEDLQDKIDDDFTSALLQQ